MPFILNCEPNDLEDMARMGAIAVDAMAQMNLLFFKRFPHLAVSAQEAGIRYDPAPGPLPNHEPLPVSGSYSSVKEDCEM